MVLKPNQKIQVQVRSGLTIIRFRFFGFKTWRRRLNQSKVECTKSLEIFKHDLTWSCQIRLNLSINKLYRNWVPVCSLSNLTWPKFFGFFMFYTWKTWTWYFLTPTWPELEISGSVLCFHVFGTLVLHSTRRRRERAEQEKLTTNAASFRSRSVQPESSSSGYESTPEMKSYER